MNETPWLEHYDAGVPATLAPYPAGRCSTTSPMPRPRGPDHPALLFKGATLSYGALEQLSDACAAAFAALGIQRGDRVALLLPNCPQFFIAEFGAWKIGAIVAPLNPIYTDAEIEAPLREQGATAIVTLTRYYERVKRLQPRTPLRHVIATNIKDYFPPLLQALFTLFREKKDGDRVALAAGDHDFGALLRRHARDTVTRAPLTPDDPAVLLMSGGTTGTPKGVLGTHGAYTFTGLQIQAWNASVLRGEHDVILVPLPLFHVYANVGVQALAFVNGSTLALVPNPRDLGDLLATIRRVKPAFFNGVPDAVHRAPEPPRRAERQGRFQVDQDLLLGRRRADGRDEAALRSAHRRPHRRGLFADRSDDGAVRQPGAGTEQARIGRHAAARRARSASSTATRARARCRPARSARSAFRRRS